MLKRSVAGQLDLQETVGWLKQTHPVVGRLEFLPEIIHALDNFDRTLADSKRPLKQDKVIFELCGVLKGAIPGIESGNAYVREALIPIVDEFVRSVFESAFQRDPLSKFDPDATMLFFENAWRTRRFSKRARILEEAAEFAAGNPFELIDNKYFVWVINVAGYLQNQQRDQPFLLPVNERTAKLAGTSTVTLSLAVKRAIGLGILTVTQKADRSRGMSRLLRFDHRHEMVKDRMRSFNRKIQNFRKDSRTTSYRDGDI
ncbi:MAG: hypothetical protein JST51_08455 [Armatimonadetes bacterium]|nr:hypothetical protein [Armatimonadota bacterium]